MNHFEQELMDAGRGHLIGGWTSKVGTSFEYPEDACEYTDEGGEE